MLDDAPMSRSLLLAGACALIPAPGATQTPPLQQFRNLNQTFHIDLPAGWRQLAPNEARRLGENPAAPKDLGYVEPRHFYAVGPVDQWLRGEFDGPWLWVVEQPNEWVLEGDLTERLAGMWRERSAATGVHHEIADVERVQVGVQQRLAVLARRTSTPADGTEPRRSLDVHAPAGGQQISLSFTCPESRWAEWEPEFRRWLATLTFARDARKEATWSDRIWTPAITGAAVGLVLLLLYRHTRRRG